MALKFSQGTEISKKISPTAYCIKQSVNLLGFKSVPINIGDQEN